MLWIVGSLLVKAMKLLKLFKDLAMNFIKHFEPRKINLDFTNTALWTEIH